VVKPPAKSLAQPKESRTSPNNAAEFRRAKITALVPYKHPTGLFELQVPQGWEVKDTSSADRVALTWLDPSGNALIAVQIFPPAPDAATLAAELEQSVREKFGDRPGFVLESPIPQPDGSLQILWGYEDNQAEPAVRIQGHSFLSRDDAKTTLLVVGGIAEQMPSLRDNFQKVLLSYRLNSQIPLPTP
jgi:hypothetical protein